MTEILIYVLVFYFVQLVLPTILAILRKEASLGYLLGPRDAPPDYSDTVQRAKRAANNMQESLLIFLPLAVLAIANNAAVTEVAFVWLGLRVAYLVTYVMGLRHIRTLIWGVSIVCLYLMGAAALV